MLCVTIMFFSQILKKIINIKRSCFVGEKNPNNSQVIFAQKKLHICNINIKKEKNH